MPKPARILRPFTATGQSRLLAPWLASTLVCASVTGAAEMGGKGPDPMVLEERTSCALPDFRNTLLQQINTVRAVARTCGETVMPAAAPLVWNERLFSAAARHALDMAANDHVSHTGRDGRNAGRRISSEGYDWSRVGENVAGGQSSVTAVMKGWLASPGHCANIMRAEFQDLGVACVYRSGTTHGHHWAMKLGRPR